VEKTNAGDLEGSLAYFAEDAVMYLYGFPPTGFEKYTKTAGINIVWSDSIAANFEWQVEIVSEDGNLVFVEAQTWHDFTRSLGVAPLTYHDVYEVVDGKIVTYVSWLTADAYARFRPAFDAAVTLDPPAGPPAGRITSVLNVTTTPGACNAGLPTALKAGEVTVNWTVQDTTDERFALTIFTLDPGKDAADLMVSTYGNPPSWAESILYSELGPGETGTYTMTVPEGNVYLICWAKPPDRPVGLEIFPVVP